MGLTEKRMANTLETEKFPGWKKQVEEVCPGWNVTFEPIDWNSMVKEGFVEHYPNNVEFNFFEPLVLALKDICSDKMGQDALKGKFKKIKITSARPWSSLQVNTDGDTIHLDADPSYNRIKSDNTGNFSMIKEAIEKSL